MTGYRRTLLAGIGAAAAAALWAGSASAQYYGGYDPYYDGPRRGYGHYRHYDRGYHRGYHGQGYGYGPRKRGYFGGYGPTPGHNPYAGFTVQRGPYGSFAVPINPGTNGNPDN